VVEEKEALALYRLVLQQLRDEAEALHALEIKEMWTICMKHSLVREAFYRWTATKLFMEPGVHGVALYRRLSCWREGRFPITRCRTQMGAIHSVFATLNEPVKF
jgi:hypothetical protein